MSKVGAVIRREFVERVRRRSFWVMAMLGPVFFAAIFLVYETAMAWIFAGQTRYRVPWDFVLALLAAAALSRLPFRPFNQKR